MFRDRTLYYPQTPLFGRSSFWGEGQPETRTYVQAHLRAVGASPDLFTKEAVTVIFQHSKGLPRRINKIATAALLKGVHKEVNPIDAPLLEAAIKDLIQE